MLTYEKLKTEEYLAETLKNENQIQRRTAAQAEIRRIATYMLAMGMMMTGVLLYLSADSWLPVVRETLSSWGWGRFSFLPW